MASNYPVGSALKYRFVQELNVPIPRRKKIKRTRPCMYPFDDMPVKGSFFVYDSPIKNMQLAAHREAKKRGTKYLVRTAARDGKPGVRVWRVK